MKYRQCSFSRSLLTSLFVISLDIVASNKSHTWIEQHSSWPRIQKHSLFDLRDGSHDISFNPIDSISLEERLIRTRGGSDVATTSKKAKASRTAVILMPTMALLWFSRDKWIGLFSKAKLESKTLEILNELNSMPKHYSYTIYTAGMALWETIGLSTIPIETAAGMVFGWTGLFLSGGGKLIGAMIAFLIGRYGILAQWIHDKFSENSFLQLVQDSTEKNPLKVAFLLRLSCFPEPIKNYGSAILSPIRLFMFVLATVVHQWTFTALWTYLGVDTAARLESVDLPPDRLLQKLLGLALVNGFVVTPLAMAYWVKSLKAHKNTASGVKRRQKSLKHS